ncbi:dTDP-4-dehydrorhamnose reductase [Desulfovibrio sp. OttesenSCG-928-I05]|nr:dTDP-4-dehydrorhamnose reductase [Desulfovibrio sp. OttesenSCG-928-I05]
MTHHACAAAPSHEDGQKRALVLGGDGGLLGQALVRVLEQAGYTVRTTGRNDFGPCDTEAMTELLDAAQPHLLFNTVAYTQVDQAEDDEDKAFEVNRFLPAALGRLVAPRPLHFTHFSTDFVFDGKKETPYSEEDEPAPLSVYGKSKLAGEQALLQLELPNCCIVRSAWLFGPGKKNFVKTILDLCSERQSVNVVYDQTGSPTYTMDLAAASLKLAEAGAAGVFHVVNSGSANWCEFAAEAVRLAQLECGVNPIPSSEYPQKAKRPAYTVLDTAKLTRVTGITPRPWPKALADYVFSEFADD